MSVKGNEEAGRVLTFTVGEGLFCLSLEWVYGVCETGERELVEKESGASVDFRGEKLPLVDLSQWFSAAGDFRGGQYLVIGKDTPDAVARIGGAEKVMVPEALYQWPSHTRPLVEGVFAGVVRIGGRLALLVDPEGLVREAVRVGAASQEGDGR